MVAAVLVRVVVVVVVPFVDLVVLARGDFDLWAKLSMEESKFFEIVSTFEG